MIHGAAQWASLTGILTGQTLVFSPVVDRLDPEAVAQTIEAERPTALMMVGDAIARPLAAEFEKTDADLSSLSILANGGAILSPTVKQRLLDLVPKRW